MDAFGELWERHEALTRDYAKLLHDDAGQVLTAIALRLGLWSHLGEAGAADLRLEVSELQQQLDDLLDRFRDAQAALGGAAVAKRGLAAGLSQMARHRGNLPLRGALDARWTGRAALAAFRIIEAAQPSAIESSPGKLELRGAAAATAYMRELARQADLHLHCGAQGITISISDLPT